MNAPLLVIDLQTAMFDGVFIPPIQGAGTLVAKVRAVLEWARRTGHPVAFIRHDAEAGDPLAPNEPGWPVWPALGQRPDEPTFGKNVGDAFSNPALESWVRDQGASGVILLGAQSEFCVSATTKGALLKGFEVIVAGDAHSTWDADGKSAGQIIEDCNAAFAEAGASVITVAKLTGA
jgi:nicotinamidase-related amidase